MLGLSLLIATFIGLATAEPAGRRPMIEVSPATVTGGFNAGHGFCPCFRWTVGVQLLGGSWETREFLISTDSLFQIEQSQSAYLHRIMSRVYTVGAIEALWKRGHVGIGFEGITVGDDLDRSYADIVRTGLYVLINLIRTDAARLDIRTGYQYEQFRVNLGPAIQTSHNLPQSLILDWNDGGDWTGDVYTGLIVSAQTPLDPHSLFLGTGANSRLRLFTKDELEAGLGLRVDYEYDPFREIYGLAASNLSAMLYMDLSWVPEWRRP